MPFFTDLGLKQSSDLFITEGFNVTLNCSQIGTSHNSMYWFRQRPGRSLEPIVYVYVKSVTWEKDFKDRASTVRDGSSLDLTLYKLQSSDKAVYFCAKQDAHQCSPTYSLNKNLRPYQQLVYRTTVNILLLLKRNFVFSVFKYL